MAFLRKCLRVGCVIIPVVLNVEDTLKKQRLKSFFYLRCLHALRAGNRCDAEHAVAMPFPEKGAATRQVPDGRVRQINTLSVHQPKGDG